MEVYPDAPLWLTTFAEYLYDDVKVEYWNDDAEEDPLYALQFSDDCNAWIIAGTKTILELGL